MLDLKALLPRHTVPALKVPIVGGAPFDIHASKPERFTLVVFYRGYHCPICRGQLRELEAKSSDFRSRGVDVIAISSDAQEKARRSKSEWGLANLNIGYDLDLRVARAWGLYVSARREGTDEPALFTEPGIFLVRPDATLYFCSVQSMPFARPHVADLLAASDLVVAKNYPARGEVESLA